MWRYALTLSATLLLFSAPAVGAGKPSFQQADKNGDSKISIKEATQAGVPKEEAEFNDLDDDGKLAKADWRFVDMETPDMETSDIETNIKTPENPSGDAY